MLSLIIPCFNEAPNIDKLLENLELMLKNNQDEKIELIIVDNGSTDNSFSILEKSNLFLEKKINVLKIKNNIGYGNGVFQGIKFAKGNYIAWCHSDLQLDPHDVIKIFKKYKTELLNKNCIIKGKRTKRNFIDTMFTFGMTLFTYLLFRVRLNDINAQPKMFHRNFLHFLEDSPKDFSFDFYFLLKAKQYNYKIYESPVIWRNRYAGEAKGGDSIKLKLKLTARTLNYMLKLKKNYGINRSQNK